jgi:hypothetical protein
VTGLAIAATPEALTPAWLTEALRSSGMLGAARSVTGVRLESIGTGQMSDSLRLLVAYDAPTDAPPTMVAKLPAADETSRATGLALRNYEREVRFYQQLAGGLPVRTPAAYYADLDPVTGSFVLLLEDLAPARPGDQLTGCSPATAQRAVDELVRLHAPRWDDPTLTQLEWLHRDPDETRALMLALLPDLWAGFSDRYAADIGTDEVDAGRALFGHLDTYLGAATGPWTIVHGDFRLDNLLLDPTPGGIGVAVVDWQTCAHGPALSDVAYFLGAGLSTGDRREAEVPIVRRYHGALVDAGVTGYGWDRCWNDYRRGTWSGLVTAVAASMLVERTARGDQMFLTMASRHARHALDLDARALL